MHLGEQNEECRAVHRLRNANGKHDKVVDNENELC